LIVTLFLEVHFIKKIWGCQMARFFRYGIVLCLVTLPVHAGPVFVTTADWDATLRVMFTENRYEADLVVFVSPWPHEALGKDEIWHYVQHRYQASIRVFVTRQNYLADLKVYVSPYRYEAGWRRAHAWAGRLSN
jgi:hypothetical protein